MDQSQDRQSCVAEFPGHKYGINCVAFAPNNKYIVSVSATTATASSWQNDYHPHTYIAIVIAEL